MPNKRDRIAMIREGDGVFWIFSEFYLEYTSCGWIKAQDYYRKKEAEYTELRRVIEQETIKKNLEIL